MQLLNAIKLSVSLSPLQIERISLVDTLIDRDANKIKSKTAEDLDKGGISYNDEYLEMGIFNLKLYYVVALLDPLNKHAVSINVDPFWHSHILHTREYLDFCNQAFGVFIHHEPLDKTNKTVVEEVKKLYQYTLKVYDIIFTTDIITDEWWPNDKQVCLHYEAPDPALMQYALFKRCIA